ncbi:MAG: hypothetical protein HPZ91_15470 [Lentisphaeria bacterium]|nr:hypothetical protein [Lentisphaeria bacterium]
MNRIAAIVLALVCGGTAFAAFERSWSVEELMKWQGATPENVRRDSNALRAKQPVFIESKVHFAKGQYRILKLTIRTAEAAPVAPFTAIALFQGGSEAGNHYWNSVVRFGVTPGSNCYGGFLTVPADATEIGVKLRLGENGSRAGIVSVTLSEVTQESLKDREVVLSADPAKTVSRPTAFHFGANVVADFPGIEAGTRPGSEPGSKRAEFIRFLNDSGLRAARYPGGTECHWFLPESLDATKRLFRMSERRDPAHPVAWADFKSTMKEAGVKLIYQLNTSFFLSDGGEILPVEDTYFPRKAGFKAAPPRLAEAAAALERNFKNGVFVPGDVDYWEIGNEEFAYMDADRYARICAAFIPVIVKYDPGRPICVTGFKDLPEKLKALGVWKHVTGITTHYPYASWPRPTPGYLTADYQSFANADVRFSKNLANASKGEKNVSVSETSVYNLFTYDFNRMQPAFALGLAIAGNWPELLRNGKVDMAVFHDFESNYFGLTRYDAAFSEVSRTFSSLNGKTPPQRQKGNDGNWFVNPSQANSTRYFPKQFVTSPGMEVFGMLSVFAGGTVVVSKLDSRFGFTGNALVGTDAEGRPQLFVSNPLEIPVLLTVRHPGLQGELTLRRLDSDSFAAVLPDEYRRTLRPMKLDGGQIILPARSVTLLTAK